MAQIPAVMGCDEAWLYYEQLFYKGGGRSGRTAWHQDMPFYQMAESLQISGAWISLDPLPKERALEFIPGTHVGPLYNTFDVDDVSKIGADIGRPPMPDIQGHRDEYNIVSYAISPGDLLVIHPQIIHGGGGIAEGMTRRTFTVNVFGPEVRYEPRPTELDMKFPGLAEELSPGDLLRHRQFAQLRPMPAQQQ